MRLPCKRPLPIHYPLSHDATKKHKRVKLNNHPRPLNISQCSSFLAFLITFLFRFHYSIAQSIKNFWQNTKVDSLEQKMCFPIPPDSHGSQCLPWNLFAWNQKNKRLSTNSDWANRRSEVSGLPAICCSSQLLPVIVPGMLTSGTVHWFFPICKIFRGI